MKKVNFNALQHIAVPDEWIKNALAAQPKKKPFFLRPQLIGAAAALVIAAAVTFTLLHTNGSAPLSPDYALRTTSVVTGSTAPQSSTGTVAAVTTTTATESTAATGTQAVTTAATAGNPLTVNLTAPPETATVTAATQPAATAAKPAPSQARTTSPAAPPVTEPTAALEPWQPFSTEPPDPLDPGVGDPDDPVTYPPQPVWDGEIEIQIASTSRFFDSSAVYIHLHNWQEDKAVWPVRSEQERLWFSVVSADKKTAVYPSNGLIRQYDQYHMMIYDRRGQVQDFYFSVKPYRTDRTTVPKRIVFILE